MFEAFANRRRQILVPDDRGGIIREGSISENMIGVAMRVDDMPDGQRGALPDGFAKLEPVTEAAARIDHGDACGSDDETDIRRRTAIGWRGKRYRSLTQVCAGRNLRDIGRGRAIGGRRAGICRFCKTGAREEQGAGLQQGRKQCCRSSLTAAQAF
jgi:hypothetical protein